MRVQTLISGEFPVGTTNGPVVFFESLWRSIQPTVQFRTTTALKGHMVLQGRMNSDLPWFTITTDASGDVQSVVPMPQYRVQIFNADAKAQTYTVVMGG